MKKVPVIDPLPMLCPGGWCRATEGDNLIYRNQGHLAATFTREKYGWLGHRLGDPGADRPGAAVRSASGGRPRGLPAM